VCGSDGRLADRLLRPCVLFEAPQTSTEPPAGRPNLLRAATTIGLAATTVQYAANELYYQHIRYIDASNRALLSRTPIITLRQRARDLVGGVVDRFFGLGVATKIGDADYLVDQEVQRDLLAEEQADLELELARLEALYASSVPDADAKLAPRV
jgi:hypothetical protein